MSASDVAAWWGAAVATVVLAWDLYKWGRSGPQLEVSASPNMKTFGGGAAAYGEGPFVLIEVRNNGDRKTTLTHFVGVCYRNRLDKLLNREPKRSFLIMSTAPDGIPYILEAGERWMGVALQNNELVQCSHEGHLCLGVYHSGGKRAVTAHVVIHPALTQQGVPADGFASFRSARAAEHRR